MRRIKTLADLTDEERGIIAQVISLMHKLPDEPIIYLRAIGMMREKEFGVAGRGRGAVPKGYIRPRK
ncbi:hypothetical protein [Mycobacterium colombiense]|nr:hypothetical protein [Mycobacterium colombiense]